MNEYNFDNILAKKRQWILAQKDSNNDGMWRATAVALPLPPSFHDALRVPRTERAIIAEIGRKSPYTKASSSSKDLIEGVKIAEQSGATALAIYTDNVIFGGGYEDVLSAAQLTSLPILCKDFIFDPIQILAARAHGASAITLIVTLLSKRKLKMLALQAWTLGLGVVVEAHTAKELSMLTKLRFGSSEPNDIRIITVSSRNLTTNRIDNKLHSRVAAAMPEHMIRVAEGDFSSVSEIKKLNRVGYEVFLVDTWLRNPAEFEMTIKNFAGRKIG